MYTCAPSDVIQGRSLPAKSMICAVQSVTLKSGEAGSAQRMADTEICAARNGWLIGITNVVACSAPVEPRSTLASPPPNTTVKPAFFKALSMAPCRFGVAPKSPVHSCVPLGSNHDNEVIAMKPPLNAISGSLLPKDNCKGVMEKLGAPCARTATAHIPERMPKISTRSEEHTSELQSRL